MRSFTVIFVLFMTNRLEIIQVKANSTVTENIFTNNIDYQDPTCKKPAKVTGCKTDSNKIKLFFSDPLMNITESLYQNEPCCNFTTDNNYFLIDAECAYKCLFTSPNSSPMKFLNESLFNIKSECPDTEVLDSCYPKNFKIAHVLLTDDMSKMLYISLNISWDIGINCTNQADITIIPNSINDRRCLYQPLPKLSHNLTENNILMADSYSNIEGIGLLPGCSYNISILDYCSTIYTIPDYVQNGSKTISDCTKFNSTSTPKILDIKTESKNVYLVMWDPGETEDNRTKIENVEFAQQLNEYGTVKIYDRNNSISEHTSIISLDMEEETVNNITGKFINIYGCPTKVSFSYYKAKTLEPVIKQSEFSSTKGGIIVGVIVIVVAIVLISVFQKSEVKRFAHKLCGETGSIPEDFENNDAPLIPLRRRHIPLIPNENYISLENVESIFGELELPRENVIIKEVIGNGAFGRVYSAKAKGIEGIDDYRMVAVKTVGEDEHLTSDVKNDFIAEIEIFKSIGSHPNIVRLFACCTKEIPYMMIMELVPCGDLKKYLVDLRRQWMKLNNKKMQVFFGNNNDEDCTYIDGPEPSTPGFSKAPSTSQNLSPSTSECVTPMTPLMADFEQALEHVLDPDELQHFAFQIASGMAHLEKIPIIHRDLAARNILINQSKVLKISDFGLSRSGPYINHKSKKLPLRWMAVEAIVEQKYDSKSDVWSFGVVLWEIGTLGAFPYEKIPDSYFLQYLQLGNRLERPEICSGELYALMRRCWEANPADRPTFKELVGQLDVKKHKVYVDFSQLNPTYVFPPSEMNRVENPIQIIVLPGSNNSSN